MDQTRSCLKDHQNNETDKPWINANLKLLIKKRQKAFTSGDKFLYEMLRNKVNRERKRCRKEYYNRKVRDLYYSMLNHKIGGEK